MIDEAEMYLGRDARRFWSGEFGDAYTTRNRVDWRKRVTLWSKVMHTTGARSIFEVGCNAGWNLSAIRRICPDAVVTGFDVNRKAIVQARAAGLNVWSRDRSDFAREPEQYDLVFTAGVLIHQPQGALQQLMEVIVRASAQWVVAVEYAAEQDEEVEYRGHTGKLWRRPFGKLYEEMGLKIRVSGLAGEGFDNCTFWIMEKPR